MVKAFTGGPGPSAVGPRLSHVHVKVSHGRVALHLFLSEAASIAVTVKRIVHGRLVATRCRTGRHVGRRCRTSVKLRTLKLRGKRGSNVFKLRIRVLRPGRYTLSLVARDRAGRRSRRVVISFAVPTRRR